MCGYDREITRTKTLVIMNNEKEIPFGAFDSELMHQEISIPEGFEATIDGNKIILTRIENEDEKIRKALIEYFNEQCDMSDWNGVYGYQVVAWLEKQGEHKKFRDSIQVGDEVTRNSDGVNVNLSQLKRVAKKDEKQGEQKPIDKIQLGKKYKCIASPRYSTFRRGNIYKPVDNFLCNLMNLCYECFEPIEDSEQKPTDEDMKETLRTEYEKGRADAIAQMQKGLSDKEKQSKLCEKCMNAPINSKERAQILTECRSQSCWYKGY